MVGKNEGPRIYPRTDGERKPISTPDDKTTHRHYMSFMEWLSFVYPVAALRFQAGQVGLDEGKKLVREWAADITARRQNNQTKEQ